MFEFTPTRAKELIETFTNHNDAKKALESLSSGKQFYNAIESPVGQEIISDIIKRKETLLIKIAKSIGGDEKETDMAKMEFKVLDDISRSWAKKIIKYTEDTDRCNKRIIKHKSKGARNVR